MGYQWPSVYNEQSKDFKWIAHRGEKGTSDRKLVLIILIVWLRVDGANQVETSEAAIRSQGRRGKEFEVSR